MFLDLVHVYVVVGRVLRCDVINNRLFKSLKYNFVHIICAIHFLV